MEAKALIRKQALQIRDRMPKGEHSIKSQQIMQRLCEYERYRNADAILVYISYRSEVDTGMVIRNAWENGKRVYCPKVHGTEMEFYEIQSMDELVEGYQGIREPIADKDRVFEEKEKETCLMIMPGSAFDRQKNRIGYGGGYYDKYLEKHPQLDTIAVCFDCQMQKSIPADTFDRKPDVVMTECMIYR